MDWELEEMGSGFFFFPQVAFLYFLLYLIYYHMFLDVSKNTFWDFPDNQW